MTYGVYYEGTQYVSIGGLGSIESARKHMRKGCVLCSEKEITIGYELKLQFHKRPRWRWVRWDARKDVGFISFEWRRLSYTWADKIIETFEESEAKKAVTGQASAK